MSLALPDVRPALARGVVDGVLHRGGGWLTAIEANALLAAVGIGSPRSHVVHTAEEAVVRANRLGYPITLKALGVELSNVELAAARNLPSQAGVRDIAARWLDTLGPRLEGVLVQHVVDNGPAMMVGAIHSVTGHVIVCGCAGIPASWLYHEHPVTSEMATDIAVQLRNTCGNVEALGDVVLRISELVTLCPEILELDVDPLKVVPGGALAIDVRARVLPRPLPSSSGRQAQ